MGKRNFRKHIALLLSVFMLFSAFNGSLAFAGTSSVKVGEKTISSAADFPAEIAEGETYVLAGDIDLSEGTVKQISKLAGTLDGKGHTIILDGQALSDSLSGTVQNLGVATKPGEKLSSGKANGSIAMVLSGTIKNCFSTADVYHTGYETPGGIAGKIEKSGAVQNTWFAGTVTDSFKLPGNGIVFGSSGTVKNCVVTNGSAPMGENCKKVTAEELNTVASVEILNTVIDSATGFRWEVSEEKYPVLKAASDASGNKIISSAADFPAEIAEGETYELASDIDLSEGTVKQISKLAGTLDGKGHTITLDGQALSDNLSGTVQNLGVTTKDGGKISSDKDNGSFAMTLSGAVKNCFSTATVEVTGWIAEPSGITGKVEATGIVQNTWFAGALKGIPNHGITRSNKGTVKNCLTTAGSLPSGTNCKKVKAEELNLPENIEFLNADRDSATGFVWEKSEGTHPVLKAASVVVDKTKLSQLISQAEEKVQADYEQEGWAKFETALAEAKKVNENAQATAGEVKEAEKNLEDAIAALEKKPVTKAVKLPENAKEITSADDLKKIGKDAAYPVDGAYKLTKNITLTNKYWNFIEFDGILDGQGHTVKFENAGPVFNSIQKNAIVQNLHLTGTISETGSIARNRVHGAIVNCYTEVKGSNGAGFAQRLDGGSISNCYSASEATKGALFEAYGAGDNALAKGTMTNVYWVNTLKNVEIPETVKQTNVKAMTEEEMQTKDFVKLLNENGGEFASKWGQNGKTGYPYFGPDQDYNPEEAPLPIEKNKYPVVFTPEFGDKITVENQTLVISPDEVSVPGNIAGVFSLEKVPAGKKVVWGYQDVKPAGSIMVGSDKGVVRVDSAGRAVVTASIDGEIVAAVRVNASAKKIAELKLLIDGEDVTNKTLTIAGSEIKRIKVQGRYEGEKKFSDISSNRFTYVPSDRDMVDCISSSSEFSFLKPGTDTITVTSVSDTTKKATVKVTSTYVPVKSVKQTIGATQVIHGINANSYDRKAYNPIYAGVSVTPENASNRRNYTITSSNPEVAEFTSSMVNGYVPFRAGETTFTILLNDKDPLTEKTNVVSSKTDVTFKYENPITKIEVPENIEMESFAEKPLDIKFTGAKSNYSVSDTEMKWTYSKEGIVQVIAKPESGQFYSIWKKGDQFNKNDADYGMAVTTPFFGIKSLKEGTVTVTGTPVDQTKGVKPVEFTVTVKGGQAPEVDTDALAEKGLAGAKLHIADTVSKGLAYDSEWALFTHVRSGGSLSEAEISAYYKSASDRVKKWSAVQKPTDMERVALAMSIIGKDITDIEGVNLAEKIYNHPNLQSGSNELAYALISLDALNTEVPKDARFTREKMIEELLKFQNEDGGFRLKEDASASGIDTTAMALQALAPYTSDETVKTAVSEALHYLKSAQNADHGYVNAEADAQVILALTSLGIDPLDEKQGFCGPYSNLITSLMKYYVEGENGFSHIIGNGVNDMATTQAAQALESYMRFKAGKNVYWNLNDMSFERTEAKVELTAKMAEGKVAVAEMSKEAAGEFASSVASSKAKLAVINVTEAESKETEVVIPKVLLEKLKNETGATLEIRRNDVKLGFDRTLIAALDAKVKDSLTIKIVEDALTKEEKKVLGEDAEGFRIELYADSKKPIEDISPEAIMANVPVSSKLTKPAAVKIDSDGKIALLNGFVHGENSDRYTVRIAKADTFAVIEKAKADALIKDQETVVPGKKISVKFSLYGDSCHGDDGTVHTMADGNLTEWIGEKTVEVSEDATVKDVLETALADTGYEVAYRFNGTYVSGIKTPEGELLEEFGNGINSGWKYALNGKYSELSLADQKVKEDDVIIWHYTDDYTKEKEPVKPPVIDPKPDPEPPVPGPDPEPDPDPEKPEPPVPAPDPDPEKPEPPVPAPDPDPEKPEPPVPAPDPDPEKPVTPPGGDTNVPGSQGENAGGNGNQGQNSQDGAVQTGDTSDMNLPVLLVSVCGLGILAIRRKKSA